MALFESNGTGLWFALARHGTVFADAGHVF
jgi:hypothetical protein